MLKSNVDQKENMSDYLVSVIIPTRNAGRYIERCVNSILNQTLREVEIIIVESGSVDDTVKICTFFSETYQNIHFTSLNVLGVSAARNKGIDMARGKYIFFIDADDYIKESALQTLYEYAQLNNTEITCANYYSFFVNPSEADDSFPTECRITPNRKKYFDRLLYTQELIAFSALHGGIGFVSWNKLFLRDFLTTNNIRFHEDINASEDRLFNLEAFFCCKSAYISSSTLYYYQDSSDGLAAIRRRFKTMLNEHYRVRSMAIKLFYSLSNDICTEDIKKQAVKNILDDVSRFFLDCQFEYFESLYYTENLDFHKSYILFGASSAGKRYVQREGRFDNLIFVDNDKNKDGTELYGYKVISPEKIKDYYMPGTQIIISSMYYFEILTQLIDMGIISSPYEVTLDGGKPAWVKIHADMINNIYTEFFVDKEFRKFIGF